jgi:hypothetical protein
VSIELSAAGAFLVFNLRLGIGRRGHRNLGGRRPGFTRLMELCKFAVAFLLVTLSVIGRPAFGTHNNIIARMKGLLADGAIDTGIIDHESFLQKGIVCS